MTASDGFTYVVGTTQGDLGTNRSDGSDDLFLSKVDSEGKVVWQRDYWLAPYRTMYVEPAKLLDDLTAVTRAS